MEATQYKNIHYDVDLFLNPEQQSIKALVEMKIPTSIFDHRLSLFLHRELLVSVLSGQYLKEYVIDTEKPSGIPFMPDACSIHIDFQDSIPEEKVCIHFEYEGKITEWPDWSANVITEEWTELGLYFPWFPFNMELGEFSYAVRVHVPDDFIVRGVGAIELKDGTWMIQSLMPMTDFVIVVSRNIKLLKSEQSAIPFELSYVHLSEATVQTISDDLSKILNFYTEWFGGIDHQRLTVIESPREKGGGYARKGVIVLGGMNDDTYVSLHEAYVRYLAHEAAHLWWLNAPTTTWEDWLNESFAEFCALLIVKEMFGKPSYEKRLRAKQEASDNTPSIWEFNRSDSSTDEKRMAIEAVLYSKGPVILGQLKEIMGCDLFLRFCEMLFQEKASSTEQVIAVLKALTTPKISDWFENQLKLF